MRAAASSIAITPSGAQVRDETKYGRMLEFARGAAGDPAADVAPTSRRRACRVDKVLAAVVQLLEKTLIRVGNDEYARDNQSFGLTTLQDGHARVTRSTHPVPLPRQEREVGTTSRSATRASPRIVRRCQELPGQRAVPVPRRRRRACSDVGSADVNDYLREVTGQRRSRPRTSAPGPARCSRRVRCRR